MWGKCGYRRNCPILFVKTIVPVRLSPYRSRIVVRNSHLTLSNNPLPYGCGSIRYNVCGFVGSDPEGDDRTTLPWARLGAWIDGAVCTFATDDFKTYCVPGA